MTYELPEPCGWAISYNGKTPYKLAEFGDGALLDAEVKRQGGTTCKMPLYTADTLLAEVAQAEQRGAEAMREKCKLACLRVGSVREVLDEIKGMK